MDKAYCCVKGCNNNTDNYTYSFFRFPKDSRRQLWLQNCGRLDLSQSSTEQLYFNYRVCSLHFEEDAFSNMLKNHLRNTAVPTLFNFKDNQFNSPRIFLKEENAGENTDPTLKTLNEFNQGRFEGATYQFTRRKLFEIWLEQKGKCNSIKSQHIFRIIMEHLGNEKFSKRAVKDIQKSVHRLCYQLLKRWRISSRCTKRFLIKNASWLDEPHRLPKGIESIYSELSLLDSVTCRLCLSACKDYTPLYDSSSENSSFQQSKRNQNIKLMIEQYMPTFDLTLSTEPVICDECISELTRADNFFTRCLSNQDQISRYKDVSADTGRTIKLPDMLLDTLIKKEQPLHMTEATAPLKSEEYFDEPLAYDIEITSHPNSMVVDSHFYEIDVKVEKELRKVYNLSESTKEFNSQKNTV